jgi:hypothetical protein
LHPDLVQNIGIALILFLQGVSMPLEKVKQGAGNWKLHVIIQSFTFVIFPLVGLGFAFILQTIWPDEPRGTHLRFTDRPELNPPADHVLSSVPAVHKWDPGKPVGETTGYGFVRSSITSLQSSNSNSICDPKIKNL